ncbi:MAG: endonuclease NucS domain-containing protein [Blastocatellia bacterium]
MAEEVKIWSIQQGNKLRELQKSRLDLEERIEGWMAEDISILSSDLLVIGRQVATDFGGFLDLLCLDSNGNTVIVELKRHKTPREVTSQVLDYAAWINDLSNDTITNIANEYLGGKGPLEKAFAEQFKKELPGTLNENHSMLVVASEIDSSSERIIKYLSDVHGININAATFNYFKSETGGELLARIFLIEPSQVEYKTQIKSTAKSKRSLRYEELQQIADKNGVEQLYRYFIGEMDKHFYKHTTKNSVAFTNNFNGSWKVVFSLIPSKSSKEDGLYFQIYFQRFIEYSKLNEEEALSLLPERRAIWKYYEGADSDYSGFDGYFNDAAEVQNFLNGLGALPQR